MHIQMENHISIFWTLNMVHEVFVRFDLIVLIVLETEITILFVGRINPTDTIRVLPRLCDSDLDSGLIIDTLDGDGIDIKWNVGIFVKNINTRMAVGRTGGVCFNGWRSRR